MAGHKKWSKIKRRESLSGFTIVELLIVVAVIAVLAAVTIVAYNGISTQAKEAALKSDLESAAKQIQLVKAKDGSYPADTSDVKKADTTTLSYTHDNAAHTFCLEATSSSLPDKTFFITDGGTMQEGECPSNILVMQTITAANCPTDRIVAKDARDNHTYWVQKLADGKCWMLTNLAYAGGTSNEGVDTYGDTRVLANGTGTAATYTEARYYVHAQANPTLDPVLPSVSSDGGATDPQYGYLYNWCAAMGAQLASSACMDASTPAPDVNISVCPDGWRLPAIPVGNSGEFTALNIAVNAGSTLDSSGLREVWLAQYSGQYTFNGVGTYGLYWSSAQYSSKNSRALVFTASSVAPSSHTHAKSLGFAVRCLAT